MSSDANWLFRFPALARLRFHPEQRRVPVIRQLATTDCGAACLAMVLSFFGRKTTLDEVRARIPLSRDGASAAQLVATAAEFGLRGRGVRLEAKDLHLLPSGSILHWGFQHFVVLERKTRHFADLVDPSFGRRRVSLRTVGKQFTGVALVFEHHSPLPQSTWHSPSLLPLLHRTTQHAGRWPQVAMLSIVLQVLALALPGLTGAVVDAVVPRADVDLLWVLLLAFCVLALIYGVAGYTRSLLLLELRTHLDFRLSFGFLEHLISLPYAFFLRRSAGDLLTRLQGMATVREVLTTSILSALVDGSLVAAYLLLIGLVDVNLVLLVTGLAVLQTLIYLLARQRQRLLLAADLEEQARAHSYEVELIGGMETLKSLGCEQRVLMHWSGLYVDVLNMGIRRGQLQSLTDALLSALRLLGPLLVLLYGAFAVLSSRYSLGTMLALSALGSACLDPIYRLIQAGTQLGVARVHFERLAEVMHTAPERAASLSLLSIPTETTPVLTTPTLRGDVTLQEVTLRYSATATAAVQSVSLAVKAGQFVAIVGATGSGKSSLARLMIGLYPPTSGAVLLDGVDLTDLDLGAVRRQLGVVTQHTDLFATTIRQNIAMSHPAASLSEVESAAQLAQIHDDIMAMPLKYETPLTDRGLSLSGGQRQRISLARALLRRPAILLLDEATSALDAQTESHLQSALAQLDCTRIVIAHRLSTIYRADLIVVMEHGQIVQQGTHEDLLRQPGVYAQLVSAQVTQPAEYAR